MVMDVILAALAALGIVLAAWCLIGSLLLPADGDGYCLLMYHGSQDRRRVRAWLFLQRSGLLRLPLYVVDCGMSMDELEEFFAMSDTSEFRILDEKALKKLRDGEMTGVFRE